MTEPTGIKGSDDEKRVVSVVCRIGATRQRDIVGCFEHEILPFFSDYEPELYDLNEDKTESKNLTAQLPEKAQQLDRRLKARMRALYPVLPKPTGKYECMIPRVEEVLDVKEEEEL